MSISVNTEVIRGQLHLLHYMIEDTGIGMTPEAVEALFQPFYQAGEDVSRKYGGTGLGLVISQGLVSAMGGKIGVKSTLGKGSVFEFSIRVEALEPPSGENQKLSLEGWKIFICDPCEGRRRALQDRLSRMGAVFPEKAALYDLVIADEENCLEMTDSRWRIILTGGLPEHIYELKVLTPSDRLLMKPLRWRALQDLLNQINGGGTLPAEPPKARVRNISLRVLVADDNSVNRKIAGMMLNKLGCDCSFAENGEEVLKLLHSGDFDACLMDCRMPVMDGFEVTRRIRSGEAGERVRNMPVIAFTAGVSPDEQKRCSEAGMDGFVSKPLEMDALLKSLEKYSKEPSSGQK